MSYKVYPDALGVSPSDIRLPGSTRSPASGSAGAAAQTSKPKPAAKDIKLTKTPPKASAAQKSGVKVGDTLVSLSKEIGVVVDAGGQKIGLPGADRKPVLVKVADETIKIARKGMGGWIFSALPQSDPQVRMARAVKVPAPPSPGTPEAESILTAAAADMGAQSAEIPEEPPSNTKTIAIVAVGLVGLGAAYYFLTRG